MSKLASCIVDMEMAVPKSLTDFHAEQWKIYVVLGSGCNNCIKYFYLPFNLTEDKEAGKSFKKVEKSAKFCGRTGDPLRPGPDLQNKQKRKSNKPSGNKC